MIDCSGLLYVKMGLRSRRPTIDAKPLSIADPHTTLHASGVVLASEPRGTGATPLYHPCGPQSRVRYAGRQVHRWSARENQPRPPGRPESGPNICFGALGTPKIFPPLDPGRSRNPESPTLTVSPDLFVSKNDRKRKTHADTLSENIFRQNDNACEKVSQPGSVGI